jgi:basic membrane protein A
MRRYANQDLTSGLIRKKLSAGTGLFAVSARGEDMHFRVAAIAVVSSCFLFSVPIARSADQPGKPLKIGFIMVGPVSDYGYNYAHDQARQYLKAHLPNVETTVAEAIPESGEVERVMEKMIAQGNRLIFSTSYGYLEPAQRVAKRHPDVTIMQTWRPAPEKNMGMYAAYQYEPLYAVGMVAGKMTKNNKIGLVCAHPVPVLLQYINSFTLGAKSVNPKVKVHVVWTNSWSDATLEAEAAKGLIESGVDVLGAVQDSPKIVVQTAERHHIMVFSTQSDCQKFAPQGWLTGSKWNWNSVYLRVAQSVKDGKWTKQALWLGMKDGAVEMSSFGKRVPQAVKGEAQAMAEKIKEGKFVIFKGPLKDREGKERLSKGQIADAKWLSEMNFLVDGVTGSLPKR